MPLKDARDILYIRKQGDDEENEIIPLAINLTDHTLLLNAIAAAADRKKFTWRMLLKEKSKE